MDGRVVAKEIVVSNVFHGVIELTFSQACNLSVCEFANELVCMKTHGLGLGTEIQECGNMEACQTGGLV